MNAAGKIATSLICGLLVASGPAAAATQMVYRCGPQGNQYSQQPCESGRAVDVDDTRSPEQIAEARKASAAQHRLAVQMANERRANERAMPPPLAGGIGFRAPWSAEPSAKNKPRKPKTKSHTVKTAALAKQKEFVAIAPASGNKKRRTTQD